MSPFGGRTVAVIGTGTGVGKTTVVVSWLRSLRGRGVHAIGWKAVETGGTADRDALAVASGHSLEVGFALPEPISPHRAARRAGRTIDIEAIASAGRRAAAKCDVFVVETAGGAFTPLRDDGATNMALVSALRPSAVVLVAADRLGVLHDVGAVLAGAKRDVPWGIVLTSVGSNAHAGLDNLGSFGVFTPS